ncbi:MAG: phosphodiester glycosidase family protein [Verrucomicrobia bacterium]|nr:phosphodiester glycosidase family protein [Verrucomicrobiota bacterium]
MKGGARNWVTMWAGVLLLWFGLALMGSGAEEAGVERVEFEGVKLRVVRVEAKQVSLVWQGKEGGPLRTFGAVRKALVAEGRMPKLLMNAGIFEPGGIPSGLHVEKGKELRPVNVQKGEGNFFLEPNGVLEWTAKGARISESKAWAAVKREALPEFALQSGPLLVLGGRIHPAFNAGSPNVKHRNGVGVDAEGRLVFAITNSNQVINFHTFARLFRDELGCQDALFLDGDISQMAGEPEEGVESNWFGAVLVVE